MKTISILSALVFAHAAFAQATDSTSVVVSTTDSSSVDVATSTSLVSSTVVAATSTSTSADVSSSATSSATGTKTGSKSASGSKAPTSTSSGSSATPTNNSGSIWEDGTKTITSSSGNPFLPGGISAGCSAFLTKMDSDKALAGCLTPMMSALASFTTTGSGAYSEVPKALNTLCASNACSSSMMGPKLTEFNNACSNDFATSDMVMSNYDLLYILKPLKDALCTKNSDTQAACVLDSSSGSSKSKRSTTNIMYARNHLVNTYVKRGSSQTYFAPNPQTFETTGLLYNFATPDMSADALCSKCSSAILSKYVAWESTVPYAMGLASSPMLGGQVALWKAMQNTCPAGFMTGITNAAGTPDSSSNISGASPVVAGSAFTAFAGALAALVVLV